MEKRKIAHIIIGSVIGIIILCSLALLWQYYTQPECYLVEQGTKCSGGEYYKKYNHCFESLKLDQCCKGNDYIMKGVYGDKTCWWILSGQNESLLK